MEREVKDCGITIRDFRGDNCIYKSAEFRMELKDNNQTIIYYGAGAHHKNVIVKSYIHTMVEKSRTVLLNTPARWTEMVIIELWTFTFRYIVPK